MLNFVLEVMFYIAMLVTVTMFFGWLMVLVIYLGQLFKESDWKL